MGAEVKSGVLERVTADLLDEVRAMRQDMAHLADELGELRQEVVQLRAAVVPIDEDPVATIRRLWTEGLESGIAGDIDEVFDELLAGLPAALPAS